MKNGDVVFVFSTFDLLSSNLLELLLYENYHIAKIYAQLERKEGKKLYYAADVKACDEKNAETFVAGEFAKVGECNFVFLKKDEIIKFLTKYGEKFPDRKGTAEEFISSIKEYFETNNFN